MIAIILSTRSEIIKMSPIIWICEVLGEAYSMLHAGQRYFYEMDRAFFEDLEFPQPKYNLDVGSGTHDEQTGKIMTCIESILLKEKNQGCSLSGGYKRCPCRCLRHVETSHQGRSYGGRSLERRMQEKINRVVLSRARKMLAQRRSWANPFGDERSGERIIPIILERCS